MQIMPGQYERSSGALLNTTRRGKVLVDKAPAELLCNMGSGHDYRHNCPDAVRTCYLL